ncbi:MAG: hypothetical protein ACRDVE_15680 [Actinocrinis sp.]
MRVRLNCFRDGHRPGEVVDLDDGDAAPLLALGGAWPVLEDSPEQMVQAGILSRAQAEDVFGLAGGESA